MNELQLSASEIAEQVSTGKQSARHFTQLAIDAIRENDSELNSFISVCDEAALEQADKVDQLASSGKLTNPMPLAGVPIAIKDCVCTEGHTTTSGSKMLKSFVPPYNATVVQRLTDAGAICVGKTNLDEFAMGSSTENSAFGVTLNPWSSQHVAGGSSGGSAACVAASMVPLSIGSDTGGSIRQPAAFCGITGLKPTYGRVSRNGLIAFASSLDQLGPMAHSAKDIALLMNVIAGHDAGDSTSSRHEVPDFLAGLDQPLTGLKIGICKQHFESGLTDESRALVESAIEVLKTAGATTIDIELPNSKYAVATYYVVASCEASSNLSRFDGVRYTTREPGENLLAMYERTRETSFGDEVKRRVLLGTYSLSSGYDHELYLKASKVRRLIKNDYESAFSKVDLILGPTTPTSAFEVGQHTQDPLAMYMADIYTVSANLAGVPAISLPCGLTGVGLPVGLQLQAPMFDEATLLRAAHHFQSHTDFHQQRPQPAVQ